MKKVQPQIISPYATGPNTENTPWPQGRNVHYKKGGEPKTEVLRREKKAAKAFKRGKDEKAIKLLDTNPYKSKWRNKRLDDVVKMRKGGSKGFQNGPTGFGY